MKRLRLLVLSLSILLGSSLCASADTTVKEGSIIKHESKESSESVIEKVMVDKPIIIQFENKLNTKNNNGIYVYEKDGEKPIDVNISFGEDEKELIITPKNDFKYDTEYIIFIVNLKFKDKGLSAFNMYNFKTQSEVEKKENKNDVGNKEKVEKNDEIFYQPGIEKYLLKECIDVEEGIVYVSQESSLDYGVRHYKPESEYIEDINIPVYNLLTSRLKDNERGNFTRAVYVIDETTNYSSVYISITQSEIARYPLYGFTFEEKNIDKDINPYEAPIRLRLNMLGDGNSENPLYDEYYVKRLEKDLEVLYGDIGSKICEYIDSEYRYSSKILVENKEAPFIHNKKINNITVYSVFSSTNQLQFYFLENNEGNK